MIKLKMILLFLFVVLVVSCGGGSQNDYAEDLDASVAEAYAEVPEPVDVEPEEEPLGDETDELISIEPDNELWGRPVRGMWDGNIWTSEYLGLYFYLPEGWEFASDEEIVDILGLGSALILGAAGMAITDEFWEGINAVLYDMLAFDLESGSNIQVLIERMPSIDFGVREVIEYNAELLPHFGMNVNIDVEPRQIGGLEWEGFEAYMDEFGFRQDMTYYLRVVDGFAVAILVTTYNDYGKTVDDYLRLFGYIGDAPEPSWEPTGSIRWDEMMDELRHPALEQPDDSHPLVGTWEWNLDREFVYNFMADGTGTRGFPGAIESFTWETSDDHLVIRLTLMDESWTFTISGDNLRIDSRQVAGMTWSYIRQS